MLFGRLTQWLECYLHTVEVRGSNPLSPIFLFMDKQLFDPKRIELNVDNIILIPDFRAKKYYKNLKNKALKRISLIGNDILIFEKFSIITGFLGYSNLLLTLEFIEDIKQKDIFFLGTGGVLKKDIKVPCSLNVIKIYSSSIFKLFSKKKSLNLNDFLLGNIKKVKGVSVDLIQRETKKWLREQLIEEIEVVDMELFPLRVYLKKPFYALIISTDIVRPGGIEPFFDNDLIKKEFVKSYELIKRYIDEKKSSIN